VHGGSGGRGRSGTLCPVCIRATRDGRCAVHGAWKPHQLLTRLDRRQAARVHWQPFEPDVQACPRCLGEVVQGMAGMQCLDHGHGLNAHGPFQVDELLGAAGQRESALARERLARSRDRRTRQRPPIQIPRPSIADVSHAVRLALALAVVACTLAFLAR